MIKIIEDNIVNLDVDGIVNAANSFLFGGGGIDGAIHKAAGQALYDACDKIGHCDVGQAVITPGFDLKARYIIHTVGPMYAHYDIETNEKLLRACYINSLNLAKENNLKSIAFPCISTGAYGYPLLDACNIALDAVKNWLEKNNYEIDIYLVCFRKEEYNIFKQIS